MIRAIEQTSNTIVDTCVYAPWNTITQKVRDAAEAVFGYLARIITFQLGEMQTPGAYWIMRVYQLLISCDPKEEKPFDPERLRRSKEFLMSFGGVESFLNSGNDRVHTMTFSSRSFFEAFQRLGSVPINIQYEGRARRALLDCPELTAKKFYFPMIDITMPDGTTRRGALLPEHCPSEHPPHILHSHSPGRSMCMDRKLVGRLLAAGYDLTIWDPPGTAESTGIPSEGGQYLAIEAVYRHLLGQGVLPNRMYASGFCGGAAVACYLKQQHHGEGLHLVVSNPYTSMKDVFEKYGWLGRMGAAYGLQGLKDPALTVTQDGFDNIAKLRNLPRSNGKLICIHTDTDTMMPRGSASQLMRAFGYAEHSYEMVRIHSDVNENGHLQPPYEDPFVWYRYVHLVN